MLLVNTKGDRHLADFLDIINKDITVDLLIFCPNIASNNVIVKGLYFCNSLIFQVDGLMGISLFFDSLTVSLFLIMLISAVKPSE